MAEDWKDVVQNSIDYCMSDKVRSGDRDFFLSITAVDGLIACLHAKGILSEDDHAIFSKIAAAARSSRQSRG